MRRLSKILTRIALSLGVAVALLVAAEIAARLAEPGPFNFLDESPYIEKIPGMGHVHKTSFAGRWDGSWYGLESHGLRGPEWKPTFGPEEFRVLAVGDSCTFGKGVDEPDCWPRQLERLLQGALPAGRRALVANAGVNGYSAQQYLAVIRGRAELVRPNWIVVGYNLNDFPNQTKAIDESVHQGKGNLRSAIRWDIRNYLSRFALFRWLRATYYVMHRDRDFADAERMSGELLVKGKMDPERVAKELARLDGMAAEARTQGAQLCIFLFPYESQVYLEKYDSSAIDLLRGWCEERGIVFVTMLDEFRARARSTDPPKELFLRGDRYHPRPEGYGIVAARVLDAARSRGWLPRAE